MINRFEISLLGVAVGIPSVGMGAFYHFAEGWHERMFVALMYGGVLAGLALVQIARIELDDHAFARKPLQKAKAPLPSGSGDDA
ncbi:hypothetical protein [Rhizobium leguminosarum]|uniref:hypothetical protein n=1 Tax=Rhizobium leguminosarum TaxID=384 RepID=UPI002E125659|nr:hypothetical protein U8Q02_44030 [Rhizobium leguminosarum]